MTTKNIFQRINAVMKDAEYIQKGSAGKGQGQGVLYDEVIAMLRKHLINHGIAITVRQIDICEITRPDRIDKDGVATPRMSLFQGKFEVDLVNIDDPKDRETHTATSHAADNGDKAPGKLSTYAVKVALVKAFALEVGINEESREERIEKSKTIDTEQQETLSELINGNQPLWKSLCGAYKISHLNELPASKYGEVKERIKAYNLKASKSEDS